jgi:NAD(P)-dependent dehydrogenase (short-subunit alcohol dehydrogenase family)
MADWDVDALNSAVAEQSSAAMAIALDVTNRADWAHAKALVEARFGPVSILVNNAGIGPDGSTLDAIEPACFDRMIAIKLTGTYNGIHSFVPTMRKIGSGHVVNTASMAGLIASARLGAYTAAKFAVVGLSEVLRAELADSGIGVSVLCPGLVATNLGATTEKAGSLRIERQSTALGIDPDLVGQMVMDGIRHNHMHIVSHAEYRNLVVSRMDHIVGAFDRAKVQSAADLPGADVAQN